MISEENKPSEYSVPFEKIKEFHKLHMDTIGSFCKLGKEKAMKVRNIEQNIPDSMMKLYKLSKEILIENKIMEDDQTYRNIEIQKIVEAVIQAQS